jgi:hypothetical protein
MEDLETPLETPLGCVCARGCHLYTSYTDTRDHGQDLGQAVKAKRRRSGSKLLGQERFKVQGPRPHLCTCASAAAERRFLQLTCRHSGDSAKNGLPCLSRFWILLCGQFSADYH